MFKKILRLRRKDLERFFSSNGGSKSRYCRGGIISMRAMRNQKNINRFAFVVSGVKPKGAALRNLARRRMAEAVRAMSATIPPGWDVIFFLKLNERRVPPFSALKEDIKYVISKNIL